MEYRIDKRDAIVIVRIAETRATLVEGVDDLKNDLIGLIDSGSTRLIVDMRPVEFADSSMLGTLVSALKAATRKHGDIKIFGLQAPVHAIFEMTRLYRVFELYESEEDAVASF